jgi:hypothetical protein
MISCVSVANTVQTETPVPTITSTSTAIPTTTSLPTYAYLPTITPPPSSTPFIITPSASQSLTSQNSKTNIGDFLYVAIEEEKFFLEDYRSPVYQVLLTYKNSSKDEIKADFFLVSYQGKEFREYPDFYNYTDFYISVLGEDYGYSKTIPIGESRTTVDIYIWVNENYSQCTDGSLEKPLYLLLFVDILGSDNPLEASKDLNKRIYEIPCKYP